MADFCLVHGSAQNASGWHLLVRELERRGHACVAADLPANEPGASATRYAHAIAAAVGQSASPPIVVAHSASGLFLPLVPSYAAVSRLVFLAAVIPEAGKSAMQLLQDNPDMLCRDWVGKDPTSDEAVALEFLFHDCEPGVARWALTTRRLMFARQALFEVCPLDRWPDTPCSYILCRDDRTLTLTGGGARCRIGSAQWPSSFPAATVRTSPDRRRSPTCSRRLCDRSVSAQ